MDGRPLRQVWPPARPQAGERACGTWTAVTLEQAITYVWDDTHVADARP